MLRCYRCQGSKKIAPMGGIYIECDKCQGIGYVQEQQTTQLSQPAPLDAVNMPEPEIRGLNPIMIPSRTHEDDIAAEPQELNIPTIKRKGRPKGWKKPYNPYNPQLNV